MSDWQRQTAHPTRLRLPGTGRAPAGPAHPHRGAPPASGPARVTLAGADWLASASDFPRSVHALWHLRPSAPSVLPCGTAFDVISTAPLFGRHLLDRLWSAGPGSGPVAVHRDRTLLFAAPGTADRLPALLDWEEWHDPAPDGSGGVDGSGSGARESGRAGADGYGTGPALPQLLCHGRGDAVTIPALHPADPAPATSRWVVAPDVRHPWLPGPDVLLWACIRTQRAVRAGRAGQERGQSIFTTAESDAKVYDVSGRR
ncbi:hypothetical protein [Streptomyces sp. ODS28]|uniref:hypothetical protein n=1 Tax=Streptomyces sp. ODS28 TaxID=3136688 RepID=UPI0031EAB7FF